MPWEQWFLQAGRYATKGEKQMQVAMKHTCPHDAYIKMSTDITFSLVFQATSGTFRSNDMMATFRECKKKKKKKKVW